MEQIIIILIVISTYSGIAQGQTNQLKPLVAESNYLEYIDTGATSISPKNVMFFPER
jgi:hypothetical protein